jgi:hypothetical protein
MRTRWILVFALAACGEGGKPIVDAAGGDSGADGRAGDDAAAIDAAGTPDALAIDAAVADDAAITPDAAVVVDAASTCPVGLNDLIPARLAVTTDDNTKVWLNGALIDDLPRAWSNPQGYDVMIYAHPGHPNVLAIEGVNLQNQAGYDRGIVADLRFTVDGQAQTVLSGAGFAATNTLAAGWEQPGFDDSAWPPAVELGAVGIAPWGAVLASLAPGSTAQWIWTYDPAANPNKPTVESTYARRRFTTVDARCPVAVE